MLGADAGRAAARAAGAWSRPPARRRPPAVIARTEALGFAITHVYGLTETYGPITICEWNPAWDDAGRRGARAAEGAPGRAACVTADARARGRRRACATCPRDGETMGEVVMRGNNVMQGYFADEAATAEAFRGGWFHSGDLARHAPGRLHRAARPGEGHHHLRRREHLLDRGRAGARRATRPCSRRRSSRCPDEKWGERPKAFVALRAGRDADRAEELIAFARETLPGLQGAERRSSSASCRRPRPARSRSTSCASASASGVQRRHRAGGRRSATLLGTACKTSAAAPSASRRSAAHGERGATL